MNAAPAAAEVPQAIVPAQARQAAASTGDWTLVGSTVAPGFDFARFRVRADARPGMTASDGLLRLRSQ